MQSVAQRMMEKDEDFEDFKNFKEWIHANKEAESGDPIENGILATKSSKLPPSSQKVVSNQFILKSNAANYVP